MRKVSSLVALTALFLAGAAWAQGEAPAAPEAAAPAGDAAAAPAADAVAAPVAAPAAVGGTTYVSRGLTQSAGNLQVTVPVVLNLSKEAVLKPVWVPLDVRYGVTDQLEVFLSHAAPVGPIAAEGGVCLGGTDRGCDKLYNNLQLGAQFSLVKDSAMELAAIGALVVKSLDPDLVAAVDVGVNFKYVAGAIAIKAAPQLIIGANKRSEGNKEGIFIPVQIAFQATPELAAFVDTGIAGMVDHFGDLYTVPVGVGASFAVSPTLDVGAEFMAPAVITGMKGDNAFDSRMLALFAQWRLK
jgi:hypothetical protein